MNPLALIPLAFVTAFVILAVVLLVGGHKARKNR